MVVGWPQARWLFFLFSLLLLAPGKWSVQAKDLNSHDYKLIQVIEVLSELETGKKLLKEAISQWGIESDVELLGRIQWGKVSRTDAILTRQLDPDTGKESKRREVTVYLKKDQGLHDSILDLAHELTHALSGPQWDPYDPELTVTDYIKTSIEGRGGEVAALINECTVDQEIEKKYGVANKRCKNYFKDGSVEEVQKKMMADFYRVGKWYKSMSSKQNFKKEDFPHLSDGEPELYSSTGHAPYPVALYEEYVEMTQVACQNSHKRLDAMRVPASLMGFRWIDQTKSFLEKRCTTQGVSTTSTSSMAQKKEKAK